MKPTSLLQHCSIVIPQHSRSNPASRRTRGSNVSRVVKLSEQRQWLDRGSEAGLLCSGGAVRLQGGVAGREVLFAMHYLLMHSLGDSSGPMRDDSELFKILSPNCVHVCVLILLVSGQDHG